LRLKLKSCDIRIKDYETQLFIKRKNGNAEKLYIYIILANIKGKHYFLVLLRSHGFASVSPTQSKRNANISRILAIKSFNELSREIKRPVKQKRREIVVKPNDKRRESSSHKKRLNGELYVRLNKHRKLQKLRNAGE
jgi:hypothetical protein